MGKSETRRPKAEGNPKAEIRMALGGPARGYGVGGVQTCDTVDYKAGLYLGLAGSLEGFEESFETVGAAVGGGFVRVEEQHRQAKGLTHRLCFSAPEVTADIVPEHDSAHLAGGQALSEPVVEARVGPLEDINAVGQAAVGKRIHERSAGLRVVQ